jgi:hypothetical protein
VSLLPVAATAAPLAANTAAIVAIATRLAPILLIFDMCFLLELLGIAMATIR